ncbi:MAG TPA: NAD-dependent epimerase/dehydratase family protein [Solirubrobacteraceae bacterium]|nr:NAD-dependent epimerase/dehydratase family protein [Solirubrobacteraceae bacterium]
MAPVFLTGGSGFIGGELCARLVADGEEVRALARSPQAALKVAARGAEPWDGHLLDEDRLTAGMAGCALAYHVAGVNTHCPDDPDHLMRVNVGGTEAVIRAAARAGVRRVVMTSSAASVGEPHGTVGREDTAHRGSYLSVYDRSKHEGELAAFAAGSRLGVEVVALNPSSVQGPGRASGNGKLIIDYLNGKLPAFVDVPVSIVDIADVADAHRLAAERGRPGARYVLNGATVPSPEALELVADLSGVRERVRLVPPALARTVATLAEGVARARGRTSSMCRARVRTILHGHRYDGSLAVRELGLDYTPLAETFARTMDWAVAEGLVTRPLPGRRAAA